MVAAADQRIRTFHGGRESSARILACPTEDCYQRIGGGKERGVAVLNQAIILSPRGLNPVIAAHEMSHVELHRRLDSGTTVPQWFDEGLAVVVSDDLRYLQPRSADDRCTAQPGGALPQTLPRWLATASADGRTAGRPGWRHRRPYARAACAVHRWIEANGGEVTPTGTLAGNRPVPGRSRGPVGRRSRGSGRPPVLPVDPRG